MHEHYFTMPLRKPFISAKLVSHAHSWRSKLLLASLFFTVSLLQAQCPSPPGDPAVFGNNTWNVYVYDHSDLTLTTTVYSGYYTDTATGFDTPNIWSANSSPASMEGWTGCAVNADSFTFVYKRKGFPCGTYSASMNSWDDAAIIYIDGVAVWSCADTSCDGVLDDVVLNEDSEIEIRVREDGGNAFANFSLINNTPTIAGTLGTSGSTTICANTKPGAITLSGYTGSIVKWQSAADAAFTSDVTDISSTAAVLTSAAMSPIAETRYFRAVIQNGSCTPQYPVPVEILVPAAVTYSAGAWSSYPGTTNAIIIDDDMALVDDIEVCSCLVKSGKTLTVDEGVSLTVTTSVNVEAGGHLVLEDSASLVQIDDLAVNTGDVAVKRKSQPMKTYDYTYWSSPVQSNTLYNLSPLTMSDKYYRFDPIINNWVSIAGGAAVMEPGRGYIVRAPQGWAVTNGSSGVYNGQFNGVPNNGVIPATIQKGAGTYNLIGNPYPSAIDIDTFLTDPANLGIINGTVYLWSHNTAISAVNPGSPISSYTADDYAKYNLTGGVRTASSAITGGSIPLGVIAAGQGFFIEAATGLANGTYAVNFNNSMRIPGDNNDFYRTNQPGHASTQELEKHRLWVTISNTQGAYNQTLVGYVTNATNGSDALYDGKPWAAGNVLSLYSVNGTDTYSIQGRALPFVQSDVVPLGYKTTIAGNFTVALEDFDGLFQNQNVYLLDKVANIMQDLKLGSYTFSSAIGTFNDRFEIHYTNTTLAVTNPSGSTIGLNMYCNSNQLFVTASSEMKSVTVYDLLGRAVYQSGTIRTTDFKTKTINLRHQVAVVTAVFENGAVVHRKVVMD